MGSDDAPDMYEQSAADGAQWERFQGAQQLQSPATLNAAQLRAACVPGVSAHGSARALARFYAALAGGDEPAGGAEPAAAASTAGLRLPQAVVAHAARPASSGTLNSAPATWGLGGFQLGRVVDTSGRSLPLVGHLGLGGVVGLAVPGAGVALAVTVLAALGALRANTAPGRAAAARVRPPARAGLLSRGLVVKLYSSEQLESARATFCRRRVLVCCARRIDC